MAKLIDSVGKGADVTGVEDASNRSTLAGKNQQITASTHTITVSDQGETIEYLRGTSIAVTLPSIASVTGSNIHTDDFTITLKNVGAGVVTVTRASTDTFEDGTTSKTLEQYEYITLQTDNGLTKWNVINQDSLDKLPLDGSLPMTGTLTANSVVVKATSGNTHYWLQRSDGTNAGLIFYDSTNEVIRINKYDLAGTTVESQVSFDDTGNVSINGAAPLYTSHLTRKDWVESGTSTLTNKTLTSPVITSPIINTQVTGTAIKDQDDMVSDSAVHLATQQSIKAYYDGSRVLSAEDDVLYNNSGIAVGSWVTMTMPSSYTGMSSAILHLSAVAADATYPAYASIDVHFRGYGDTNVYPNRYKNAIVNSGVTGANTTYLETTVFVRLDSSRRFQVYVTLSGSLSLFQIISQIGFR